MSYTNPSDSPNSVADHCLAIVSGVFGALFHNDEATKYTAEDALEIMREAFESTAAQRNMPESERRLVREWVSLLWRSSLEAPMKTFVTDYIEKQVDADSLYP